MRFLQLWHCAGGWLRRRGARASGVGSAGGRAARRLVSCWLNGLAAALLLFGVSAGQASSSASRIDVQRDGGTYFVRASAEVAADLSIAWATLTDYERLPQFVPNIHRVQVLTRDGNRLTVAFNGGFRLLFFEWPVRVRLVVRQEPYSRVLAQSDPGPVDGEPPTVREFSGRYSLAVIPVSGRAGVRLDYDARFELTEAMPPLIGVLFGRSLVRAMLRTQFEAMLNEIERRQAAGPLIENSTS
jgi:hypothetical protein